MKETIPLVPILIISIVSFLVIYGRSLGKRKKSYTYRELTPDEIIKRAQKKAGDNIYSNRSSGNLDIDRFIKNHAR